MLQPMIFLGLGGAGGKTIRTIIQNLERELLSAGYTSGIPDSWQFLHIDVTRDGSTYPAPMLQADRYLSLVPSGATYADLVAQLTQLGVAEEQKEMLAGWAFPASPINIGMGAGQMPAFGRVAGLANANAVKNVIEQKIATMISPQALKDLAQISKVMNLGQPNSTPRAFIFSSLTGGLGAGIYSDVKEILSSTSSSHWVSNPISFLYSAEVFESVGESYNHFASNALGAVNQLISDKLNSKSLSSELLYSKIGLSSSNRSSNQSRGKATEFLVGSRTISGHNISIGPSYSGMDQVFKVVGESVASVLTNDETSEWFELISDISSDYKYSYDMSGLAPTGQKGGGIAGFSGIGFSKITLGAQYLHNYVADALTREQVRILLWPDCDFDFKEGDPARETLIKNKAAETLEYFLPTDGDVEVGFDYHFRNSMISLSLQKFISDECQNIMVKNSSDKPQEILTYSQKIAVSWQDENPLILDNCKQQISESASQWIIETQEVLLQKITQSLSTGGLGAVIGALEELIQTIDQESAPIAKREAQEIESVLHHMNPVELRRRIMEISDGLETISSANTAFLTETEKSIRRIIQLQVEGFVFTLCAEVLSDFTKNFLQPILVSLSDSRYELKSSLKEGHVLSWGQQRFSDLPNWGSLKVPGEYQSSATERTLIDPADFEQLYESYTERTNSGPAAFTQSVTASLIGGDLVQGLSSSNYQDLVHGEKWVTGVREAQGNQGKAARKATLKFQVDLFSLGQRNRRWLQERNASFGRLLNMSISEYVDEKGIDPALGQQRTNVFLALFQRLAALSSPWISTNPKALENIATNNPDPLDVPHLHFSKIPFAQNSLIGTTCVGILSSFGVDTLSPGFASNFFDAQSKTQSVMALSVTKGNLPYWAISSFTDPTLRKIAISQGNTGSWLSFWEGRRAHPLLDSIPLDREIRRSIITGWFVAALFGMRKIEVGQVGRSAEIMNPYSNGEKWAALPKPLLENSQSDATQMSWLLPGVLSSVSIALCEFGKTGSYEDIEAYLLLKHFGREITTSLGDRDSWDIPGIEDLIPNCSPQKSIFLSQWVRDGVLPTNSSKLLPHLQKKIDAGTTRDVALVEVVTALQSEYRNTWAECKESIWFKMPHTWELRDDLDLAFSDISNYVKGL